VGQMIRKLFLEWVTPRMSGNITGDSERSCKECTHYRSVSGRRGHCHRFLPVLDIEYKRWYYPLVIYDMIDVESLTPETVASE